MNAAWDGTAIKDDPVTQSEHARDGRFAMAGPTHGRTQLFINYVDTNARLDRMGLLTVRQVIEGLARRALHAATVKARHGRGPRQDLIEKEGNTYLAARSPELDYIKTSPRS